jgi:hypothetical protein
MIPKSRMWEVPELAQHMKRVKASVKYQWWVTGEPTSVWYFNLLGKVTYDPGNEIDAAIIDAALATLRLKGEA